jgi:hypothetical protein
MFLTRQKDTCKLWIYLLPSPPEHGSFDVSDQAGGTICFSSVYLIPCTLYPTPKYDPDQAASIDGITVAVVRRAPWPRHRRPPRALPFLEPGSLPAVVRTPAGTPRPHRRRPSSPGRPRPLPLGVPLLALGSPSTAAATLDRPAMPFLVFGFLSKAAIVGPLRVSSAEDA